MNKFLSLSFALILMGTPAWADGTPATVNVVAACGTPNGAAYVAGTVRPVTQGTNGKICGS